MKALSLIWGRAVIGYSVIPSTTYSELFLVIFISLTAAFGVRLCAIRVERGGVGGGVDRAVTAQAHLYVDLHVGFK